MGGVQDDKAAEVRERAERLALGRPEEDVPSSAAETRRVFHELRVHQIELELQNEELRRLQQDLEAARSRYFELYDLAPVGYLTLDPQGAIIEANLIAARLFGLERRALVRRRFTELVDPESQDDWYLTLRSVSGEHGPVVIMLRMLRDDGTSFPAQIQLAEARNDTGARGLRVIVTDDTERALANQERLQLEQKLQQTLKAESLSRMAAAIAHRFNNLLAVVLGHIELASSDALDPTKRVQYLEDAASAAWQAAEISGSMLTYLGQRASAETRLDLAALCRDSMPMLVAATPIGVRHDVVLPDQGPKVKANAVDLRQVLSSLVTNAWEAIGDRRGTLGLRVGVAASAQIPQRHRFPVDWEPSGDRYGYLEISDDGSGIRAADIPKLFDPFFTQKGVGRGMGLAVALGVARAHGGGLTVDSQQGRGSRFRLYLPLDETESARQHDVPAPPPVQPNGSILLVEDERSVREVASAMLRHLGYDVIATSGGREAIEVIETRPEGIRLVLCDLTMPEMDGWQTLTALRALVPGLPVILTSGYDEAQAMSGAQAERVQAFLGKPFNLSALQSAITSALEDEES